MPQYTIDNTKVWTKEEIKNLIETDDMMVMKSLVKLHEKQTAREQNAQETIEHNNVGFNGRDAYFGTSVALQAGLYLNNYRRNPLTENQIRASRNMLKKYVGQLTKIANHEI